MKKRENELRESIKSLEDELFSKKEELMLETFKNLKKKWENKYFSMSNTSCFKVLTVWDPRMMTGNKNKLCLEIKLVSYSRTDLGIRQTSLEIDPFDTNYYVEITKDEFISKLDECMTTLKDTISDETLNELYIWN